MISLAWLLAVIAAILVCLLLAMESTGRRLPSWLPLQGYLWWLSFLMFAGSVLSIMFSNI